MEINKKKEPSVRDLIKLNINMCKNLLDSLQTYLDKEEQEKVSSAINAVSEPQKN